MDQFPGNQQNPVGDNKSKRADKVVEKVVSVDATHRPTSIGRKFKNTFVRGHMKNVGSYILGEVIVPALKNLIVDSTSKGVERIFYGDSPRKRYEPGRPRVQYSTPIDRYTRTSRGTLPDQPPIGGVSRRRQDVGEIILHSRDEADLVIERMTDIIDVYKVASVADLHDLVGLPSTYVDNKWGWENLSYANVRQIREGYLLDLPPVEPIN
jgi:hypothetical protein